jgi:hypothetical protein
MGEGSSPERKGSLLVSPQILDRGVQERLERGQNGRACVQHTTPNAKISPSISHLRLMLGN